MFALPRNCHISPYMSSSEPSGPATPPTLPSLPHDCLVAVASSLRTIDLCRLLSSSHPLFTTRLALWDSLIPTRFAPHLSSAAPVLTFREQWRRIMDAIDEIARELDNTHRSLPPVAIVATSVATSDSPTAMSLSMSPPGAATRMAGNAGVGVDPFNSFVARLQRLASPPILAEWLDTRMAARTPLGCLAVLAALRSREAAPRLGEEHEGVYEPTLGHERDGGAYLAELATRLPPSPSLLAQVTLRWSTWSQLRDCRGFRARDDLHRCSSRLLELVCADDEPDGGAAAGFWAILRRGVADEVRSLQLLPE
jgi:hypothetical protein